MGTTEEEGTYGVARSSRKRGVNDDTALAKHPTWENQSCILEIEGVLGRSRKSFSEVLAANDTL